MAMIRANTNALDFETLRATIRKLAVERAHTDEELEALARQLVQDLCPEKVTQDGMIEALVATAQEAMAAPDAA